MIETGGSTIVGEKMKGTWLSRRLKFVFRAQWYNVTYVAYSVRDPCPCRVRLV